MSLKGLSCKAFSIIQHTLDTIAAGAEIVEALQHFVSRELDPTKLAVISVCRFNAGTRDNIIAGEAHLSGTVRAVEDDVREQASEAVKRITTHIAAAHRVRAEVECDYATPIVYNDPELYKTALKAAQKLGSEDKTDWIKVVPQPIVMGTEDFGRYSTVAPSFYAKVGSGKGPQLHSDYFLLDERALITLSALHVSFVNELLESAEKVRQ
jgi:metal-dependent amidase/aminoacylase/carboxypeptidase family protein